MAECYVCLDECYSLSPCKCENLYLHLECYTKLIAYNNYECKVCKAPYPIRDSVIDAMEGFHAQETEEGYDEDAHVVSTTWYLFPILCRPRQLKTLRHLSWRDVALDPLRAFLSVWMIACVLKQTQSADKTTASFFFSVFHWVYYLEWAFSMIMYIMIGSVVSAVASQR